MEFCKGGDLRTYINQFKDNKYIEEKEIWKLLLEISSALNECHSKKIIHRDIKPENIFLDSENDFKLGDFGLAREIKDDFAKSLVGTPYYLAPEVTKEENYNEKCDIWGLGCVAYEMATLHRPFETENVFFDLLKKIQKREIDRFDNRYSDKLFNLVKSMLSKDPKNRPNIKRVLDESLSYFVRLTGYLQCGPRV